MFLGDSFCITVLVFKVDIGKVQVFNLDILLLLKIVIDSKCINFRVSRDF